MRTIAMLVATGLALLVSGQARAEDQTPAKVFVGEMVEVSGTVESIDKVSRQVTLKGPEGKMVTVEVSKDAKRFDEVKVGDKVSLRYNDAVVIRLKKPDEPSVDEVKKETVMGQGEHPGGYAVLERTMTTTIDALDPSVPSVTFVGPNGWKYTRRIADKDILQQVKDGKIKVGDRVDFTWYLAADVTVQ